MSAISDLLAQATLPEHVEPICLRGDLVSQHEQLERELADLQRRPSSDMLNDPDTARERDLAQRILDLEDQMKASTTRFRLRAVTRPEKSLILMECAPREGNDADKAFGANRDTFYDAMLRAALVDPRPESDDEYQQLTSVLSDGQFDILVAAAINVSGGTGTVPFSRAASAIIRRSSETSE